ncbi:glutathione S-transferase [Mycena albidolilacea]|uniref:glutathione transferase n=1 Tax=Mycena albidolilacea TaxID=1033008 RepID=A0AAD6ZJ73_9AGAR|nr:glutathione S-transferase [Mycena albidolilacea]
MVLKLYAVPYPGRGSGLVYLLLAEKQIPFELVAVDLKAKEQKKPEFLAMDPFGQVPVIDDDGFIVYESRAICRYLAEKYADQGPNLFPKGLEERAMVEQGAAVELATFEPAILKLFREGGKRLRGLPFDQAILDEALSELSAVLDVYEVILGKQKFLGGDEYSLADLFHFGSAPRLVENGIDIMTSKGRPNVTRWWNELTARPAWAKLTADFVRVRAGN